MSETYKEITRIDQIKLTESQKGLYNSGFKNGETPLDDEHLGLLLSLVKLNYDNIVSLDTNQDNDHSNISSLNNVINNNVFIDGGGAAYADPESFKE